VPETIPADEVLDKTMYFGCGAAAAGGCWAGVKVDPKHNAAAKAHPRSLPCCLLIGTPYPLPRL